MIKFCEKTIAGSLVGTYPELVEFVALADRGLVNLSTKEYRLSEANQALTDLNAGKIKGRAILSRFICACREMKR